ncbi:MAG: thiamine-phosphate kinase [Gammaproteobacteria bacterium]|nr:MAG: thiamine-phosphate kinase [Gammaproteobacteria bacterium]
MGEFDLIRDFFAQQQLSRQDVVLGIGDDAAILDVHPGAELITTSDLLVEGVHFPQSTSAYDVGYKSLAVNLSDMAAMGAEPAWFLLSISLPEASESWLRNFCEGLFSLASECTVQLVGGDTVRGPLAVGVTMMGWAPQSQAIRRSGARPGDGVYVTGVLGDAGLALAGIQNEVWLPQDIQMLLLITLNRPVPRVQEGIKLRGLATSAIDISDGLVSDLGHICAESNVGAEVELSLIPLSESYMEFAMPVFGYDKAVSHGDDYELCFTVPEEKEVQFTGLYKEFSVPVTRIGAITEVRDIRWIQEDGNRATFSKGHDHFPDE